MSWFRILVIVTVCVAGTWAAVGHDWRPLAVGAGVLLVAFVIYVVQALTWWLR